MEKSYKTIFKIIGLFLIVIILMLILYAKYQKYMESRNPLIVVENNLSINYINGNKIKMDEQTKTYSFSITNNDEEKTFYSIYLDNIKGNQNINFTLKEKNNKLNIEQNDYSLQETYLTNSIAIDGNSTHSYEFTIYGSEKLNLSATLVVAIEKEAEEYFATTIQKDNEIKKEAQTKIGEEAAESNEGLIETTDDYGITYYFRGNVENNYVEFADMTWRIVRINGNGSVKLVLNEMISSTANFYDTDSTESINEKLDFTKSNIYNTLQDWYKENLSNQEADLMPFKYCTDDSIGLVENNKNYYLGNTRLLTDFNQTYNCLGTSFSSKIGLLNADEVVFAGATKNSTNTNYYLYTEKDRTSWWTLTPNTSENNEIIFFEISSDGKLQTESVGSYYRGIKPVITLLKKTIVSGSGTLNDPYKIKE